MSEPEDATAAALRRLERDGSDLSRPLQMDFSVAVPDETIGREIASRAVRLGFSTSVESDRKTGAWTCYCTKTIIPTYANVVSIEKQLDILAREVGGYADGFGSFGNAVTSGRRN